MTARHAEALLAATDGLVATVLDASRLIGAVQERWPQAQLDGAAFGAFLLERAVEGHGLSSLHVEDLFLAWACLEGQRDAIAAFERYTRPLITLAVRRDATDADEVVQQVQIKLLVAEPPRLPRLADYTGVGPLKAFVMVMAMRCLADVHRNDQHRRERPIGDGWLELASIAGSTTGPEARLQWAELEPHAARAVAEAMAALSVRQRTVLRLHYVEGVSAEALGRMYGVHRATTTRWLVDARERMLELVQQRLRETLDVGTSSLASLTRTLVDGLELSFPGSVMPAGVGGRQR
ncbi:MAG: sigma-70 family RNA polymerase sigma factor [Myxococcus sp.]|nr:sigma-70 family RNA polymerase sigma factor [Myxococcus sp.]